MSQNEPRPWRELYRPGLDESMVTRESTLVEAWRDRVRSAPERVAIRYFDTALTASEVDAMSDALAAGLQDRGVGAGDRVGIHLQNIPQYALTMLALWKVGAAAVVLNPMYFGRELRLPVEDSGAVGLIVTDRDVAAIRDAVAGTDVAWVLSTSAQRDMDSESAFWMIFASQLLALCTLPLWGLLSDHIGRRPVIFIFGVGTIITTPILMGMIDDRPWTLFVASLIAMTFVAAAGSILSSFMSEAFPTKMRTAGIGFAYSLSVAVFGGSAPYLNAQFIEWDLYWMISAYIIALCVCTMIATAFMKETRGNDLHRVGQH